VAGGGPSVFVTATGGAGVPVVLYQEQLAIAKTAYTLQNNYAWVFAVNSGKLDANAGTFRVGGGIRDRVNGIDPNGPRRIIDDAKQDLDFFGGSADGANAYLDGLQKRIDDALAACGLKRKPVFAAPDNTPNT
jgi:hypothetical protein